MWKVPNEDPGPPAGGPGADPDVNPHPQLADLRDENEQQQLLIAQLKEIIRKNEQTSVTAEKVEEFANTLAKAKRNKLKRETAGHPSQEGEKKYEGFKNQKVLLMKQQLEENKAKLAARGKSQKGIEEMVVQMKAQLDDSQNLMMQSISPLNISLTESCKQFTTSSSPAELVNAFQSKDKNIQSLHSRIEQLEAQILDLQENVKEKDSVIDARTKAITLMSENLSKKGKSTLDALDDTKEQMRQMQNTFVEAEEKLKSDKQKLLQQIYEKDEQIANMKESNEALDQVNKELTKLNSGLQERLNTRTDNTNDDYEKNVAELKEKIKELEDIKASPSKPNRRNRKSSKPRSYEPNQNTEMEAKITFQQSIIADKQIEIENQQEKISELEASVQSLKATIINVKGGKESENVQEDYENQIAELKLKRKIDIDELSTKLEKYKGNNEALEKTMQSLKTQLNSPQTEKVFDLEKVIQPLQTELDELRSRVIVLQLQKQAIEYSDASNSSIDVEEMNKMKKQLDDNNKNMIKSRAQHKAQIKDLQKKLDILKKGNTEGGELERLNQDNSKLLQKIAELEEEIGNLQLKMVESTDSNIDATSEIKTIESDLVDKMNRIEELENDLVERTSQIEALNSRLESLSKFENAKVSSDLNSIQLEEQLEAMEQEKSILIQDRDTLISTQTDLQNNLESIEKDKGELDAKVQSLIQENIDLLDRLEKLSAEKVSSAESIEIVEGLTNQEKLEIEAYQKNLEKQKSEDNLSVGTPELNESVNQLTEETTELLQRIELFTEERREVMEKLEQLASENHQLNIKLKQTEDEKDKLHTDKENAESNTAALSQSQMYLAENMQKLKDNIQHLMNYMRLAMNEEESSSSFLENLPDEFLDFKNYYGYINHRKHELINATKLNEKLQNELSGCKCELQNNNIAIQNLKTELQNLQQYHQVLDNKYKNICQEVDEFSDERHHLLETLDDLKIQLSDKDENYHKIVQDLKQKCLSLQVEIAVKEEPLKARITDLDTKNKELRDRMKILAANLKKKGSAFDELVKSNEQSKEKWETEAREKDDRIESLSVELQESKELLSKNSASEELDTIKNNLHQMSLTNSELQLQLNDFLNSKMDQERQIQLLTQESELLRSSNANNVELNTRDGIIETLRLDLEQLKGNADISVNTLQMKVKELEMFIESQDQELTKHKVKVERLEEGLAMVEERRSSLERRAVELGAKLQEREISFEEAILHEDNLTNRLRALAEHDAAIENELSASAEENQLLTQRTNQLFTENTELRSRLDSASHKLLEATERIDQLGAFELENEDLKQNMKRLESDLGKLDKEFQNLLRKQKSENEQGEMELHDQIRAFNEERKSLTETCEMLEEQLKDYQEHIDGLNSTITEVTIKAQDQEQKILCHNTEMQILQGHIFEMENKCQIFENEVEAKVSELLQLNISLQHSDSKIIELENNLKSTKNELDENLSQLSFAKNMMSQIEESSLNILGKNDELERRVSQLEAEKLAISIVQENVSEPVHTAALFSNTINDPFAFVPPIPTDAISTTEGTASSSTEPDLFNKIRTLEFMLYNSEQEKNDLSNECQKLSDEIANLVYDKERLKVNSIEVMSQIVPDSEAQCTPDDDKRLRKSLFTPTTSKAAHAEDSVDLGIQAVEALIQAKSAYLCYDQEQPTQSSSAGVFGENDDGWGFVVDEPRPVVELVPVQESIHTNQALLDQISRLELEREKHLEDLRQAQVKSGKLIKKLKEFKAKNDELAAKLNKKDDGFGDLESAIQDELKSQVEVLEKKVKEIQYDLEKESKQNSNLLTKINVLTNANERMVEMKEKQDIEMLGWQQRNRELVTKLDQLEWGSDEPSPSKQSVVIADSVNTADSSDLHNQIEELLRTVKDLTLDNEELQTMLEEQRDLRLTTDRQKSVETTPGNINAAPEYVALLNDKKAIQEERDTLIQSNTSYTEELTKISQQLQRSNEDKVAVAEHLNNFIQSQEACNIEKQNIKSELDQLIQIHNKCIEERNALLLSIKQCEISIHELEENLHLAQIAQNLSKEGSNKDMEEQFLKQKEQFLEMNSSIAALKNHNEVLAKTLEGTRIDIKNLNDTVNIITAEKLDLQQKILENVTNSNEIATLQDSIREKQTLIDDYENSLKTNEGELELKLAAATEQITIEWQARVDERGNNIAESWKLHVESKENEFMYLEQQLRTEIHELDQKCIGLVNENNELRKNVDAEIRNEVDRVSALQQQINDKQHCINELRRVIDEKQAERNLLHAQVMKNETTIQQLNLILQEKDAKLVDFEKEIETRQLDAEDKQSNINELNKQLNRNEVGDNKKELEIQECQVVITDLQQEIIAQQQLNNSLSVSISDLNKQLTQRRQEIIEARSEKDMISSFLDEVNSTREAETHTLAELNQKLEQYQYQLALYINELSDKDATITNLNSQVANQNRLLDEVVSSKQLRTNDLQAMAAKDKLILNLKGLLQEKEQEVSYLSDSIELENNKLLTQHGVEVDTMKNNLLQADAKFEELLASKDEALQVVYNQLADIQAKYNLDEQILHEKDKALTELLEKDQELEALHIDEHKQLEQMQQIIEDQVLKIEDLKKELYEKSSSYDALFAQVEMQQSDNEHPETKVEKRVQFSKPLVEDDLSEPVSRAELDLALYMLHQRDVRCEELTLELMQLLEERDTLQLRLSNAIREKEVIRGQQKPSTGQPDQAVNTNPTSGAVPKTRAILLGATNTELAAEATESDEGEKSLSTKLSELKSVGYRRDKTLLDEQDYRRMQQMAIMSQHIDEASKLPAEAAARLVDANYTLSRDVQSPSKVLLNWLWGRSTPKVNNI